MVWSEIPVYSDIDWVDPATLQKARTQLRDMIARDHNRASVVFWSISNETPIKRARLRFLRHLAEDARVLDPTRLITAVMNHVDDATPDVRVLNDPLGQYLDVLGLNDYLGWDGSRPEDGDRVQWKIAWEKPRRPRTRSAT
jgi:beta-glucuronidase